MEDSLRRELEPALAAEKGKRRPSYGMVYGEDGVRQEQQQGQGQGQAGEEEEDDAVRFCLRGYFSLCVEYVHTMASSHQAPSSQNPNETDGRRRRRLGGRGRR